MAGIIINGVKYVGLMNNNLLKSKSLEDNIYFTLRDIFMNGNTDACMYANHYNGLLTNNIHLEDRDADFKYSNLIYSNNSDFIEKLYCWLAVYTKNGLFDYETFEELKDNTHLNMIEYIKYDDWWKQFISLRSQLRNIIISRMNELKTKKKMIETQIKNMERDINMDIKNS
jgi:hypothetical protein